MNDIIWSLKQLKAELDMDAEEYANMVDAEGYWIPNRKMEAEDTYAYRLGVASEWIAHILKGAEDE